MSGPYAVIIDEDAQVQIQRERTWLHNHRGAARADAFEAELRHALELIAGCPGMGDPSPEIETERHWFLRRSRVHVYYAILANAEEILVVEIQPEAWQSRRW
jgi:plasmid stabilization system protein ParE